MIFWSSGHQKWLTVCFALILLSMLGLPGQAQDAPVQVTMRYDPPRILRPLVRVCINGGRRENFILDTGAGYPLILTEEYVKRANLPRINESVTINEVGQMTQAAVKTVHLVGSDGDLLPIEGLDRALVTDAPLDSMAPGKKIAGIIGVALFAGSVAQMDFKAQVLTLYRSSDALTPPPVAPLPLTSRDGVTYEAPLISGVKTSFMIDTGAYAGGLEQEVLSALPQRGSSTSWSFMVHGLYLLEHVSVRSFAIAGATVSNASFQSLPAPFRNKFFSSFVGMQLLQNFRLTFDIPHQRLYVEPNPDARFLRLPASSGASLVATGNNIRVGRVEPGSPAARAGLRVGDEVVSVDQVSVAGEPVFAIQQLLDGVVGEEAQVVIKRDTTRTLRFLRAARSRPTEQPYPCFTGVVARLIFGRPMEVYSVKSTAPLFLAGVRAGELITRINGKRLAEQKTEAVVALMDARQITLTVRSKNGKERTIIARAPASAGKDNKAGVTKSRGARVWQSAQ